jgi:hypothetical protein
MLYEAILQPDGHMHISNAVLGDLRVYRDNGDAYSNERGDLLVIIYPTFSIKITEKPTGMRSESIHPPGKKKAPGFLPGCIGYLIPSN